MDIRKPEVVNLLKTSYPFLMLNEEELLLAARVVTTRNLTSGQILYRQGKSADSLYIVLSGQIKLSIPEGKNRVFLSALGPGDIVGLEGAAQNQLRLTTASAELESTLLCLDKKALFDLFTQIPGLKKSLLILFNSLSLRLKSELNWLDKDETVFYLARRHPVYLIVRQILPIGISALLIILVNYLFGLHGNPLVPWLSLSLFTVLIIIWIAWNILDWRNDTAIITNERVVFQENILLLYDSRVESPLNQVQSITVQTSQVGRLFSFGDVIIRTYTSRVTLPVTQYPWQTAAFLEWIRDRAELRRSQKPVDEIEEELKKRLKLIPGDVYDHDPNSLNFIDVYQGSLSEKINHLFHLQYEIEGGIVYRKHWYILVKRVILPSILLLAVDFAFLARIFDLLSFLTIQTALGLTIFGNIVLGLWWLYEYLDWTNDLYIIGRDQIIDVNKKPLGREERKEAPIKNILSIDFERLGFVGLLFNFGTVYIRVGDSDLTFDYVYNPSDVQRVLFTRLAERINWNKKELLEDEQRRMADWIETYHRIMGIKPRTGWGDAANSGNEKIE